MLVAVLAILPTFARVDPVEVDGLYYRLIGKTQEAYYSGDRWLPGPTNLILPATVTFGGRDFNVIGFYSLEFDVWHEDYDPLGGTSKIFLPESILNNAENLSFLRSWGRSLEHIEVSKKSTEFSSFDGLLYDGAGETLIFIPTYRKADVTAFPENVKVLGAECAYRTSFESITIPEGVTTIGDYAFANSSVKELVIPNSVSSIGARAFDGAEKLRRLSFGTSLKRLATMGMVPNLEEVSFSSGTTSIETYIFNVCRSLRRIVVADDNPVYSTYEGILYDKDYKNLLYVPYGIYKFVAPDGFETIPPHTFENRRSLGSADLANVKSIGEYAFCNTDLYKLDLSGPAKEIGQYAFSGNNSYDDQWAMEITLSDEMTEIPAAFQKCKIKSIDGCENIKSIAENAFAGSWFLNNSIFDVVKNASKIGAGAFEEARFPESAVVELSDDIEVVEDHTFDLDNNSGNSISKLKIGPKVRRIGDAAFNFSDVTDGIYCEPDLPPVCTGELFNSAIYAFTTLYVQTPEKYAATAPWNKFNNIVYHEYSKVEEVADGGEEVSVSCSGGEMRVECADGTAVTVWSADGREAFSGTGSCTVALPRGIYIVRAGSSTRKVIL